MDGKRYGRAACVLATAAVFVVAGCQGGQQRPQPSATIPEARIRTAAPTVEQTYERVTQTAAPGQTVGDLVTGETTPKFVLQAESVVVGLDGRGTKRYERNLKQEVFKLLVKEFGDATIAEQIIQSKDAAPVHVVAEIDPFTQKGEKVDVGVVAYDPTVNLEGGLLVETPLQHYVKMNVAPERGFVTRSGLVSAGTKAYARGDVTLTPDYVGGKRITSVLPHVGYIPAGAIMGESWGCRLMLKEVNADHALMIEAAVKLRFGKMTSDGKTLEFPVVPNVNFVAVGIPRSYRRYWQRWVDVVKSLRLRGQEPAELNARIANLVEDLGSSNPMTRYAAECTLEGIGPKAVPAVLDAARRSSGARRRSALTVLGFVGESRAAPMLIEESRTAPYAYKREVTHFLAFVRTPDTERRLIEMLSEGEPLLRYDALRGLVYLRSKDAPVKIYYSEIAKSFAMYVVEAPGERAVVLNSTPGIREVAFFGTGIKVNGGFTGEVGPVSLSVDAAGEKTEIRHKRRIMREPARVNSTELQYLVSILDRRMGVSINDIMGLIALMEEKKALNAAVYWAE